MTGPTPSGQAADFDVGEEPLLWISDVIVRDHANCVQKAAINRRSIMA